MLKHVWWRRGAGSMVLLGSSALSTPSSSSWPFHRPLVTPILHCQCRGVSSDGPGQMTPGMGGGPGLGGGLSDSSSFGAAPSSYHPNAPSSLRQTLPPSATDLPEASFLKCIEKEIMDEKLRLDKEDGPPPFPAEWEFYHAEGSSLIFGRRLWVPPASEDGKGKPRDAEKHFIRAQLTTRDASLDPECDVRGEHFPFSFFVQRCWNEEEGGSVQLHRAPSGAEREKFFQDEELSFYEHSIEVRCDLIDGELRVDNVLFHGEVDVTDGSQRLPRPVETLPDSAVKGGGDAQVRDEEEEGQLRIAYPSLFDGYNGPNLDEAEEPVLDGLQGWLAERKVDDIFAEFIGSYSVWVEQLEYERWLQHLHDYVAA